MLGIDSTINYRKSTSNVEKKLVTYHEFDRLLSINIISLVVKRAIRISHHPYRSSHDQGYRTTGCANRHWPVLIDVTLFAVFLIGHLDDSD